MTQFVVFGTQSGRQVGQFVGLHAMFARQRLDCIQAFLDPVAAGGVHVDVCAIAAQRVSCFGHLDAGRLKKLDHGLESGITVHELL